MKGFVGSGQSAVGRYMRHSGQEKEGWTFNGGLHSVDSLIGYSTTINCFEIQNVPNSATTAIASQHV